MQATTDILDRDSISTAYLRNMSPTSALENMTPDQAWYGRKPGVEHLRVLESTAYVHISRDSRKSILVGYWSVTLWQSYESSPV